MAFGSWLSKTAASLGRGAVGLAEKGAGAMPAGMMARAGYGAAAGGVMGGFGYGDAGGAIGGAAAGAGMAMGMPWLRGQAGRLGSISGIAGAGLGGLKRGAQRMTSYGAGQVHGGAGLLSNAGFGLQRAGMGAQRAFGTAADYIGSNAVAVNKWGGRALAGAGVASASMIGGSILSSNRGY